MREDKRIIPGFLREPLDSAATVNLGCGSCARFKICLIQFWGLSLQQFGEDASDQFVAGRVCEKIRSAVRIHQAVAKRFQICADGLIARRGCRQAKFELFTGKAALKILRRRSVEDAAKPDKGASENWLRPEGPTVNSPARKGGGLARLLAEGQRPGTSIVPHLRRSFISHVNHALTGVAISFRAFGPANAPQRLLKDPFGAYPNRFTCSNARGRNGRFVSPVAVRAPHSTT